MNGRVAALGDSADPASDRVAVDGERIRAEPIEYWLVHKPPGVVTTRSDPEGLLKRQVRPLPKQVKLTTKEPLLNRRLANTIAVSPDASKTQPTA